MGKIQSTIELKDKMSQVINKVNQNLSSMMLTMQNASDAIDSGFDPTIADSFRDTLLDCQGQVKNLDAALDNMGNSSAFQKLFTSSIAFGNVIGNIITKAESMALGAIRNAMSESYELYQTYKNAQTQLITTLNNTSDNAVEAYDAIKNKAEEISEKGIFGKTAMMSAGAELATYFSDPRANSAMMDVLADYAMGMSQGMNVDSKQMVDYATNLGKMTTGAYEAMSKKGFMVTEVQKDILKGEKLSTQGVLELKKAYDMLPESLQTEIGSDVTQWTEDMQKVAVIQSIINESWANMYETMSNTPENKINMLINRFESFQITIGQAISNGIMPFVDAIDKNMPTITTIVDNFANAIQIVMWTLAQGVNVVLQFAQVIIDNWSWIGPLVLGVAAAFTAYQVAMAIATVAQWAYNAALYGCPLVWIIASVGALVAWIYLVADEFAKATGIANNGFSLIVGGLNVVKQVFINIFGMIKLAFENVVIFFQNRIADIQGFFWGLLATVVEVVRGIAEKLNALPFVNIDVAGLNAKADEYRAKQEAALNSKQEYKDVMASWKDNSIGNAYTEGTKAGDALVNKVSDKIASITQRLDDPASLFNQNQQHIADNTDTISESLGSNEELEYLKDLAQQETINRFTTAEIKVDMGGVSQNISKDTDADGVVDYLVNALEKSMSAVAEGVY